MNCSDCKYVRNCETTPDINADECETFLKLERKIKGYKTYIGFHDYFVPEDKQSCLICEYCSDVYYDATNGPYLFICDKGLEYNDFCPYYKVDKENTEFIEIDTKLLKGYEE